MEKRTKILTFTAMFLALVFVGTMIAIPIPKTTGFMNLGDFIIIIAAFVLGPIPAAFAGALGASLADVTLGFYMYAPFTLIIKGTMGFTMGYIMQYSKNSKLIKGAIIGEIIMVAGYFLSEWLVLPLIFSEAGYSIAIIGIPFNAIQGLVSVLLATLCIKYIKQIKPII